MAEHVSIKQNKLKNTGVLFDLLVRQITSDTLNEANSPAMDILRKYFNVNTELGKELQLYRAFFNTKTLTESKAIHFIDLISTQRKKLNDNKLSKEKYALIREIKNVYNLKDFLSAKIPHYTLYASIYKTFLSETNDIPVTAISELANAKFMLIEQLTKIPKKISNIPQNDSLKEFCEQPEDIRTLAYTYSVDKFNKKYSTLNENQKALLKEYVNSASDTKSLLEYIKKEIPKIKSILSNLSKNSKEPIISVKLNEISSQLSNIQTAKIIKESHITSLMLSYEIIKELS